MRMILALVVCTGAVHRGLVRHNRVGSYARRAPRNVNDLAVPLSHDVNESYSLSISDLEVGVIVRGTAASKSLSRRKNASVSGDFASTAEVVMDPPKFWNLIRTVDDSMLSRIFQCFNLTKATTQQKALLLLCVAGAILDPLFFYIPMINEGSKCMKSDRKLGAIAISLRSLADVLHFVQWSFYYENKWKVEKAGRSKFSASTTATAAASQEISLGNSNSLSPRNSKATGRLIEIRPLLRAHVCSNSTPRGICCIK